MSTPPPARTYNQTHVPRKYTRAQAHQHLLDLELSVGGPTRSRRNVQPLLHDDRSPQRAVAELRDTGVRRRTLPAGHRRHTGAVPPLYAGVSGAGRRSHRSSRRGLPTHRPGRLQAADRRTGPGRHRHPDGVRARPHARRSSRPRRRRSTRSANGCSGKAPACCWRRITTSASPTITTSGRWNTNTTATRWCRASSDSANTPAH